MRMNKWSQRIMYYAVTLVSAGSLLVACGDDDGGTDTPDAGMTPDATACVGHGCPGIDSPFQLNEGGEFRLERFQTGPNDSDDRLAAHAFFFKDQEPGTRELLSTPIDVDPALGVQCFDFRDGDDFDNGRTPENQMILNSRTYYNAGENVYLTNVDNGSEVITMAKIDDGTGIDVSSNMNHKILYQSNPDTTDVSRNSVYRPTIDGDANGLVALDLSDGEFAATRDDLPAGLEPLLYFPGAFTVTTPTEAEYFAGLALDRASNAVFSWTVTDAAPADTPPIIAFIAFVDATAKVNAVCVTLGITDGTLTVPPNVLEIVPAQGALLLGRVTHVAWEARQDGTRLDLLGIECKQGQYQMQDNSTTLQ